MAFERHLDAHQLPGIPAASNIAPRVPIKLGGTSAILGILAATAADRPAAVTGAASVGRTEIVLPYERGNIVKMVANASVGAAAEVAVASDNGSVGPITLIAASAHWAVGLTQHPAAAGEVVSVYFEPRKV